MIRLLSAAALAATALLSQPAVAQGPAHCPPGLAKKNPPCVPPGQAKSWSVGDRYDGRWDRVDWWRYDLPRPGRTESWVRVGDVILRVDDQTRAILDIVRLAAVVLGN
jgi:hypothetical protein